MEKFVIPCRVAVRTKRVCTGETGSGRLLPADVYAHLRLSIYHVPGSMLIYPTQSSRHSVNKQQHPQETGARRAGAAGPAPQSVRVRAGTPGRWGGVGRGFPGEGRVPGGVQEREGAGSLGPGGEGGPPRARHLPSDGGSLGLARRGRGARLLSGCGQALALGTEQVPQEEASPPPPQSLVLSRGFDKLGSVRRELFSFRQCSPASSPATRLPCASYVEQRTLRERTV